MNSEELIHLVTNIGFPALVTMYLLVKVENKLEKLSNSINDLSKNISSITK